MGGGLKSLFSLTNEDVYKVVTFLGIKIKLKNKYKVLIKKLENRLNQFEKNNFLRIKKITPMTQIHALETHIVEHCNLNCAHCGHFAPLAEKEFLDIKSFTQDYARIKELTNGEVKNIRLLGGEPLLHPKITDFCRIARELFPDTNVEIVTNGLLLNEMSDAFYKDLLKYNIKINITKYPIDIEWDKILSKLKKLNVKFEFYQGTGEEEKVMYKQSLDLTGQQPIRANFLNCRLEENDDNYCFYFENGKLFNCWKPAYIRHFNKYFKQDLKVSKQDYVNIYEDRSIEEMLQDLARPLPFCRYCNLTECVASKYHQSEKQIEEWI